MPNRIQPLLGIVALVFSIWTPDTFAQQADIPRTPDGRPDLSGTYDTATLTPLQRPRRFGDRATLTAEEAAAVAANPAELVDLFALAPAGLGIDPNRLGVWGGSAGGHLSLVLGTASDDGDPSAEDPVLRMDSRVAAVVAYYPPVDLRRMARGTDPSQGSRRFPALNFEAADAPAFSPLLHVTPDDPPTLLIHGDQDGLVNVRHSQLMYEALHGARC